MFADCERLMCVTIPDSVTRIEARAFSECSGLTGVYITDIMAWCRIQFVKYRYDSNRPGRYYYDPRDSNPLYYAHNLYLNGVPVADLSLPDGLTDVCDWAFFNCTNLTRVTIPDSVKSIGGASFYGCSSLTNVIIPNSMTSIGSGAFDGTPFYDNKPDGLVVLGGIAYEIKGTCPTAVTIPDGVTSIGESAFSGCDSLTSVTIPNSVTNIGEEAFDDYCPAYKLSLYKTIYGNGSGSGTVADSRYALTENPADRAIASVTVNSDCAIDSFVLKDGKSVKFTAVDEASVYVETVVTNACRVSFDWKCSCEPLVKGKPYDYLSFAVDGEQQAFICGETGWTSVTNYVTGDGEHLLRWMFQRDEDGASGEDCAWLANVKVVPSVTLTFAAGGKSVTVPGTWIAAHPALVAVAGGNAEAALASKAANGRLSVVECYVIGLDPESTTNDFKITSFPMKADGTPDLENIVFDPPEARWNVDGARPVVKGAARLDGEWQTVTEENKAGFRFFKVEVVLP